MKYLLFTELVAYPGQYFPWLNGLNDASALFTEREIDQAIKKHMSVCGVKNGGNVLRMVKIPFAPAP